MPLLSLIPGLGNGLLYVLTHGTAMAQYLGFVPTAQLTDLMDMAHDDVHHFMNVTTVTYNEGTAFVLYLLAELNKYLGRSDQLVVPTNWATLAPYATVVLMALPTAFAALLYMVRMLIRIPQLAILALQLPHRLCQWTLGALLRAPGIHNRPGEPLHLKWVSYHTSLTEPELFVEQYNGRDYDECLTNHRIPTPQQARAGLHPGGAAMGLYDFPAANNHVAQVVQRFHTQIDTWENRRQRGIDEGNLYRQVCFFFTNSIALGRLGQNSTHVTCTSKFNVLHAALDEIINNSPRFQFNYSHWYAEQIHVQIKLAREQYVVVNNQRYGRINPVGP